MHDEAIKDFGGESGVYDTTDGKIESILAQQDIYFGYEKYPDIFEKAAMLMYFFIKGHCFCDGNKRVGIDAAIVLLTINGFEDNLDDMDGYNKTLEIEASKLQGHELDNYIKQDLSHWLSDRFIKL